MRNFLIRFWENTISSSRILTTLFFFPLAPISLGFYLGVKIRNILYHLKWISTTKLKKPVISIGNITVGGTGKTPLLHHIATHLPSEYKLAILSRGYRSKGREGVIYFSEQEKADWEMIGDESAMLQKKIPSLFFGIGKKRGYNGKILDPHVDLFILDDGFQHRKLERDLEILCLDVEEFSKPQFFLPFGKLRDDPKRLSEADFFVAISQRKNWEPVEKKLKQLSKVPLIVFSPEIEGFYTQEGQKVEIKPDQPMVLFSAIANPKRVVNLLEENGIRVAKKIFKADHASFSHRELVNISLWAEKENAILCCTEKDGIKYEKGPFSFLQMRMQLKISMGEEHWKKMIEKISSLVRQLP